MPDPADFREDPDWLLAQASYLFPDADNRDMRMVLRIHAATEMRDIEARYDEAS